MINTQILFASSVPSGTGKNNIVTPEIKCETPSGPLALVETYLPFLLPSFTMTKADSFTTAPLDIFDQEWLLPRNVTDPSTTVYPVLANREPLDKKTKNPCMSNKTKLTPLPSLRLKYHQTTSSTNHQAAFTSASQLLVEPFSASIFN